MKNLVPPEKKWQPSVRLFLDKPMAFMPFLQKRAPVDGEEKIWQAENLR